MREGEMSELMNAQKANLDAFQVWMRESGVSAINVRFEPQSDDVAFTFQGNGDPRKEGVIRQSIYGPRYDLEGEKDVSPIQAVREIIRYALQSDDLIRNVAWDLGGLIVIPAEGPMTLSTDKAELRVPARMIN